MKALLTGLLLASSAFAAWKMHAPKRTVPMREIQAASTPSTAPPDGAIQVPVEIVTKGGKTQWVYVEVSNQAIPEPGVVSLTAVASLLLLRRRRASGK